MSRQSTAIFFNTTARREASKKYAEQRSAAYKESVEWKEKGYVSNCHKAPLTGYGLHYCDKCKEYAQGVPA